MFLESIKKFAPIAFGTAEGFLIGAATGSNVEGPFIGALLGLLTSSAVRICSELFFHKKEQTNSVSSNNELFLTRDGHIPGLTPTGGSAPNPTPSGPSVGGYSVGGDYE